ncbi:kinase-like protein, partial [Pholiota conissans]
MMDWQSEILQVYPEPEPAPFQPARITTRLVHTRTDDYHMINQYTKIQKIGKGKHGSVYLCRDESGNESAMKRILKVNPQEKKMKSLKRIQQRDTESGRASKDQDNTFRKEIEILKNCNHPNIVRLLEAIDDPTAKKAYLFQENLAGGQLLWQIDYGNEYRPILTLAQTRRIMKDLILGIEYLHHEGIIHRDIKPYNIIYTADRRTVKLIDFGIAHYMAPTISSQSSNEPSSSSSRSKGKERAVRPEAPSIDSSLFQPSDLLKRLGTPSFLAPEIVWFQDDGPANQSAKPLLEPHRRLFTMPRTRPPITNAIDIWSLGVVFYGLLFGHLPFEVTADAFQNAYNSEYTVYNMICTMDWEAENFMGADDMLTGGRHPEDSKRESTQIIHLLDRMLQKNPENRISITEIKANPWILKDIPNASEWLQLTSPTAETRTSSSWMKNASSRFLKLMPGP